MPHHDDEGNRLVRELVVAAERLRMVEPACWSFHLRHDSRRHEEDELDEFRDAINAVTEAASAINDHGAPEPAPILTGNGTRFCSSCGNGLKEGEPDDPSMCPKAIAGSVQAVPTAR